MREAGSRYIDFLIPGLVGMGIMGNSIWGLGFSIVDSRRRKLMKRIIATPMPRHYYLLSFLLFRMMLLVVEVGVPITFGVLAFGLPFRGSLLRVDRTGGPRIAVLQRARPADRVARQDHRSRLGPDEHRDAADVGALGRVLLGAAVSRCRSAGDQGASAHRADRCAAGDILQGAGLRPAGARSRGRSLSG